MCALTSLLESSKLQKCDGLEVSLMKKIRIVGALVSFTILVRSFENEKTEVRSEKRGLNIYCIEIIIR